VAVSCLEEAQRTLGALTLSDSDEDMDRNGRNENRDIVRQIQVIQNRIHELQGEIEAAQAAQPAPAPAPAPPPERPPKSRRVGHQLAATGNPQGQRTMDQDWTFMQHPQQAPAPVPIPQVGALSHHNPQAYPRRDGLPPSHRQDGRSVTPRDRECFSCGLLGHEQWECPVKKYAQGRPLSRDDQAAVQICMELFRAEGRPFPGYGSRPARLPMPPGAWQGGRGQGNGRGGRGQGRGGNFRGGRRGGGRGN
jgi:hypothetical protein